LTVHFQNLHAGTDEGHADSDVVQDAAHLGLALGQCLFCTTAFDAGAQGRDAERQITRQLLHQPEFTWRDGVGSGGIDQKNAEGLIASVLERHGDAGAITLPGRRFPPGLHLRVGREILNADDLPVADGSSGGTLSPLSVG
jgi:hypothetical protein